MAWNRLIIAGCLATLIGACAVRTREDPTAGAGGGDTSSGSTGQGGNASSASVGPGGAGSSGGASTGGSGPSGSSSSVGSGGSGSSGSSSSTGSSSSSTGSSSSSSSSTGGGTGAICGGFSGASCAPDQFCDYPADTCGIADESGTCQPRPPTCSDLYQPTCACDGKTYSNPCDAQQAGVDVRVYGGCEAPGGSFTCGSGFCSLTKYCRKTFSDVFGVPDTYQCVDLPAGCGDKPSCACLIGQPCAQSCETTPDSGLMVTCPGG